LNNWLEFLLGYRILDFILLAALCWVIIKKWLAVDFSRTVMGLFALSLNRFSFMLAIGAVTNKKI